eukprot:293682-Prymnesium_polylepis.1
MRSAATCTRSSSGSRSPVRAPPSAPSSRPPPVPTCTLVRQPTADPRPAPPPPALVRQPTADPRPAPPHLHWYAKDFGRPKTRFTRAWQALAGRGPSCGARSSSSPSLSSLAGARGSDG